VQVQQEFQKIQAIQVFKMEETLFLVLSLQMVVGTEVLKELTETLVVLVVAVVTNLLLVVLVLVVKEILVVLVLVPHLGTLAGVVALVAEVLAETLVVLVAKAVLD
jgi:hypothetical protein